MAECNNQFDDGPAPVGIALSGGGTRAAMMGLGSIRRLYELGILRRATTISSVSGGSIVNAVLALKWVELMSVEGVDLELFDALIAAPVRHICSTNLGWHVLGHKANPVRLVKRAKKKLTRELGFTPTHLGLHLAKYMPCMDIKLAELPKPKFSLRGGVPRFVFCGCDLSTGKPFYFTQEVVGHCLSPDAQVKHPSGAYPIISEELTHAIPLTQAVGASAAVPIPFEPLTLKVEVNGIEAEVGIVDGAVYDNLGLDPLIGEDNSVMIEGCLRNHQVVFVNDAGSQWFLPLEKFPGRNVAKRVMRSLSIALSRGHDEKVRFLDLMFKRHLLYGAYWRLADLERIYDKFSEEEIEELQELCFPSKQVFDPLLIAKIIDFRLDLNELKPAELRVLENAGYILAAFKFHKYVSPLLKDKNILDSEYFATKFKLPVSHNAEDISREISDLIDAMKYSSSLVKSNISLKKVRRHKKKKTPYECQFQFSRPAYSPAPAYAEGEEGEEGDDEGDFEQAFSEFFDGQAEGGGGNAEFFVEENGSDDVYYNYPRDPNHPLYHPGKKFQEYNIQHEVNNHCALPPQ
eukprot:Phypoly_transcript_06308.p1 GENE.Phypoly_transcript_06308~~Phypoly_transcript_06308.p1  ORF type:complete len:575 (+),score=88.60 Phypoly_transcript_06308:44-1768(+)